LERAGYSVQTAVSTKAISRKIKSDKKDACICVHGLASYVVRLVYPLLNSIHQAIFSIFVLHFGHRKLSPIPKTPPRDCPVFSRQLLHASVPHIGHFQTAFPRNRLCHILDNVPCLCCPPINDIRFPLLCSSNMHAS